jgi:hypothetical protein
MEKGHLGGKKSASSSPIWANVGGVKAGTVSTISHPKHRSLADFDGSMAETNSPMEVRLGNLMAVGGSARSSLDQTSSASGKKRASQAENLVSGKSEASSWMERFTGLGT